MNVYCDVRSCYLNPREGAKLSVAAVGRKCATRGARPKAISDCLNFGSPNNPEVMWEFKEVCEGIKEACTALNTPVVSGNVSLHNQSDGIDIYPSPSIVGVGIVPNAKDTITSALKNEGNVLLLVGEIDTDFAGSVAQKLCEGRIYGEVARIDLAQEAQLWNLLCEDNAAIVSAKDVGKGGLAIALTKMALLGNKGIKVQSGLKSWDLLFAQSPSCVVLEVAPQHCTMLESRAYALGLSIRQIGVVSAADICIDSLHLSQHKAKELYFEVFKTQV